MSEKNDTTENKVCVFPTKANPPHLGLVMELLALRNAYDKIYVAYYDKPSLLPTMKCAQMLGTVLQHIDDKYKIVITDKDFSTINTLPRQFIELGVDIIVTSSNKIYANCAGKNILAAKLQHYKGYHDSYQQIAYNRGYVLDNMNEFFKGK